MSELLKVNTRQALERASAELLAQHGHIFDVLTLTKPGSVEAALNLFKTISKLSPVLGNFIEFYTVEVLNMVREFNQFGRWVRQDPDFPDTVLHGKISPEPGMEIKAWFPLSTEITARFRESQARLDSDQTSVAMLAWIPEYLVYGRPLILDVCVVPALSVAIARDLHYHQPPGYLVIEPEDTTLRTRNLQQTNTAGYKWQGTAAELAEAERIVGGWGKGGRTYRPDASYQKLVRSLQSRFNYRLDTNFAKMDRIVHAEIEEFKKRVLAMQVMKHSLAQWTRLLMKSDDAAIRKALEAHLGIRSQGV